MLKDFFDKGRGQDSSKDELPSEAESSVTSGIQAQETGLSPDLQTIGRSGLKARGLARSIAAHHPARRSPTLSRKLKPALPLIVQKMTASVRRRSITGLSRAGSYLRRAVGTVSRRAPLGLSRWESYPAYRTLEGFSPTWLKPRRVRQMPFDDQVGASNDSVTPAYTWPSLRSARSAVSSSDRKQPARTARMSSAARVRNIPISQTSSHITRALSKSPQAHKPAIIVSRKVSAWIDDPIGSSLERPIAEKPSRQVVSPDKWTPREYGSAPQQDQASPANLLDNLGSESMPNSLNLRAVNREGMELSTGPSAPVHHTTSRNTPTNQVHRTTPPRTAESNEIATTADRSAELPATGARDSRSTERKESRGGLLQRSRRLLSRAKSQPAEKDGDTILMEPPPSSPNASGQASQAQAHVENQQEINANLGTKDEAIVGHLNENERPASKPESQLIARHIDEDAASVSDTQTRPTTGIIERTRGIVARTSDFVFRKSAVVTRGSDAQTPLQESSSRPGLRSAHEPTQAQSRQRIEASVSTSNPSVSRQLDTTANPPDAQAHDRSEPQPEKQPQAKRASNRENVDAETSVKSIKERPIQSDIKDTASGNSARTGVVSEIVQRSQHLVARSRGLVFRKRADATNSESVAQTYDSNPASGLTTTSANTLEESGPPKRETSQHLVGQMPPASGVFQRSRKLAARTRDLVFRKPSVVARDSNSQAMPQQRSPAQNRNHIGTPVSASKPSSSEKGNQSIRTPDVQEIHNARPRQQGQSHLQRATNSPVSDEARSVDSHQGHLSGFRDKTSASPNTKTAAHNTIRRIEAVAGLIRGSRNLAAHSRNLLSRKKPNRTDSDSPVQENKPDSVPIPLETGEETQEGFDLGRGDASPRLVQQLQPASGIVERSLSLVAHSRDFVFRKSSEAIVAGGSSDSVQKQANTTRPHIRRPATSTSAELGQASAVPDLEQNIRRDRTPGTKLPKATGLSSPMDTSMPGLASIPGDGDKQALESLSDRPVLKTLVRRNPILQSVRRLVMPSHTLDLTAPHRVRQSRPFAGAIQRSRQLASNARSLVFRRLAPERTMSTSSVASAQEVRLPSVSNTYSRSTETPVRSRRPIASSMRRIRDFVGRKSSASSGTRRLADEAYARPMVVDHTFNSWHAEDSQSPGFRSEVTQRASISPTNSGSPDADRAKLTLRKQDDKIASNPVAGHSESDNGTARTASTGYRQFPASPHSVAGPGNSENAVGSSIPIKPVRRLKPLAARPTMIHRRLKPLRTTERSTKSRRSRSMPMLRQINGGNRTSERHDSTETLAQRRPFSVGQANPSLSIASVASFRDDGGRRQPELAESRQNGNSMLDLLSSGQSPDVSSSKSLPLATRMYRVPTGDAPGVRSESSVKRELGSFPKARANGAVQRQSASAHRSPSVHTEPVHESVLVNGSTDGGNTIRRVEGTQEPVSQSSGEEQKREFSGEEIEFLSSRIYTYIKNKMAIERERHGRPGFSVWR